MQRFLLILPTTALLAILGTACSKAPNESPLSAQESARAMDAPPAASTEQAYASGDTTFSQDYATGNASTATIHNTPGSSIAARDAGDTTKKFIRTANMRFQVKDVYQSTMNIERIAVHFGGWITQSHIGSEVNNRITTAISADSSLKQTFYTVNAHLTLRVPVAQLDTTIRTISHLIHYLDHRNISAEDMSLKILAEGLRQRRNLDLSSRLKTAVDNKGQKLDNIADVESRRTDAQERADNATIQKLEIQDQILFSTISLAIYQDQAVLNEVIANPVNIDAYRPGFFSRLGDGIKTGWNGLLEFILALFEIWPVLLLLIIGIIAYRQTRSYLRKRKS